ncbi:MAG: MFS transporter [Acidobacteria bacterium]|nr:MFS transporter [Acidobacteriota bacterium]
MSVSPYQQNRLAWLVVLLLFIGSVLNYVNRAVLGVLMPQIRRELVLTNTDYGLAVNAFLTLYMVFYVVGGRLADRLGCRRSFTLTIIFWSVANLLHAFARGLRSLCFFRALLGMGEGGYYPAAIRGAAEWFPVENRAKAVALLLCGLSVGALLTPPMVAWIAIHHGWRASFLATGALGFLLVPPWLMLHRRVKQIYGTADPAPAFRQEEKGALPEENLSLLEVLKRRKYWCLLMARALSDAAWSFFLFWMPGYFQEVRGFDLRMVGRWLWIPYFSADVGALGGAWVSSMLIQRGLGLNRSRKSVLIPSAALAALGGLVYFLPGPFLALAMASVALFGHLSWASNIHTVISEITPPKHLAVLYGITGAAGTLLGAASQPLIGRSVDLAGYAPAFIGVGVAYALALVLLLGAGKIERIRRIPPPSTPHPALRSAL